MKSMSSGGASSIGRGPLRSALRGPCIGGLSLFLLLVCACALVACGSDNSGETTSVRPDCNAKLTGSVTQGKDQMSQVTTFPFVVGVRIDSDKLVSEVRVGLVQANLESAADGTWKAELFGSDLEEVRDEATGLAKLEVRALDFCGEWSTITTVEVPLGPAPGVAVSNLEISPVLASEGECSTPLNKTAPVLVRVLASPESAGANVVLKASQGTFQGSVAEEAAVTLTLRPVENGAAAEDYFYPSVAGVAVFTASGDGSLAKPRTVLVTAAPEVDAPAGALQRSQGYDVLFRSKGNFQTCHVYKSIAASVKVEILKPSMGVIEGEVSVLQQPLECESVETVALRVTFVGDAPNGTAVKIACEDTFLQSSLPVELAVEPLPIPDGQ